MVKNKKTPARICIDIFESTEDDLQKMFNATNHPLNHFREKGIDIKSDVGGDFSMDDLSAGIINIEITNYQADDLKLIYEQVCKALKPFEDSGIDLSPTLFRD